MATTIASTHATVLPQPKKVATAVGYTNADRASRSGIWIGIFAITMSFAAFTSALFVRQGTNDWTHLVLPSLLYVNTVVLLASSATFELSRRSLTGGALIEYAGARKALGWLAVTLVLGLAFCVGQFMVWQQLRCRHLPGDQSQQFLLLRADGYSRAARARRDHRAGVPNGSPGCQSLHISSQLLRKHRNLLAFHGRSLGLLVSVVPHQAVVVGRGRNCERD